MIYKTIVCDIDKLMDDMTQYLEDGWAVFGLWKSANNILIVTFIKEKNYRIK